jgi:hypothetical protein
LRQNEVKIMYSTVPYLTTLVSTIGPVKGTGSQDEIKILDKIYITVLGNRNLNSI